MKENKKEKNLKHKIKLHQLKVEFLKIQKINNLKQRCKKKNPPKNWEREITFFFLEKIMHRHIE